MILRLRRERLLQAVLVVEKDRRWRKNPSEKEEIQSAVADLPGKWPEVDEATIEIGGASR